MGEVDQLGLCQQRVGALEEEGDRQVQRHPRGSMVVHAAVKDHPGSGTDLDLKDCDLEEVRVLKAQSSHAHNMDWHREDFVTTFVHQTCPEQQARARMGDTRRVLHPLVISSSPLLLQLSVMGRVVKMLLPREVHFQGE